MSVSPRLRQASNAVSPFAHELEVAAHLAREAGQIVKTFYDVPPTVRWKDPTEPVTEADRASNAYLVRQFGLAFPGDGILAEESKDDSTRLDKRRVWIVDPIDGTAEFIAHNGEFCIMIGLAVDGKPVAGIVYQPIDDILYGAAQGMGAYVEEYGERYPLRVSHEANPGRMRLVVSRSHRVPLTDSIIKALQPRKERSIGSVGLKIGLIARGKVEYYVHPNAGTKEWDTCAPEAIIRAAGGMMTDCWNRPLQYNQQDVVRHFGLVASNRIIHAYLCARVAEVLDEAGVEPDFGF